MIGAIPYGYALWLFLSCAFHDVAAMERMVKEMDIALPTSTQWVYWFFARGGAWIGVFVILAAAAYYWLRASRSVRGLLWSNALTIIVCQSAYHLFLQAMFEPMVALMAKIGN
jgi:hypothetical protein